MSRKDKGCNVQVPFHQYEVECYKANDSKTAVFYDAFAHIDKAKAQRTFVVRKGKAWCD